MNKDKIRIILKIFSGSTIILICYYIGVLLSSLTRGFLSPSVIGMIILFLLLSLGIVKKEWVSLVSTFLLGNLILFFIPALVGETLIDPTQIKDSLWQIVLIGAISTIIVMGSAGSFIEFYQKRRNK